VYGVISGEINNVVYGEEMSPCFGGWVWMCSWKKFACYVKENRSNCSPIQCKPIQTNSIQSNPI